MKLRYIQMVAQTKRANDPSAEVEQIFSLLYWHSPPPLSHPDKSKLTPLLLSSSFSLMETTLVIAKFRESDSLKKQELIKLWSLNTESRTRYISLKKDIIRCSSSMIAVSNQAFNVCTQLKGLNNLLLNFSFNFFNGVRLIP